MQTKQIHAEDWRQTLDALSRSYDGALVSLEIVGGQVGAERRSTINRCAGSLPTGPA